MSSRANSYAEKLTRDSFLQSFFQEMHMSTDVELRPVAIDNDGNVIWFDTRLVGSGGFPEGRYNGGEPPTPDEQEEIEAARLCCPWTDASDAGLHDLRRARYIVTEDDGCGTQLLVCPICLEHIEAF